MKNKLLVACADVEECRSARKKVADSVEGVIADLHTSISTAAPKNSDDTGDALPTAFLTTRIRMDSSKSGAPRTRSASFAAN